MSDVCRHCGVPIYREKGGGVRVVEHVEADCPMRGVCLHCDSPIADSEYAVCSVCEGAGPDAY